MVNATRDAKTPIRLIRGLPLYANGEAPKHLRSKSQLRDGLHLRLAPGQQPVCYVRVLYHPDDPCALYDPAAAVPAGGQSVGALWAYWARRTCPKCGQRREYVVHGNECGTCQRAERAKLAARQERRCDGCGRVGRKPYSKTKEGWYSKRYCRVCRADRKAKLNAILAEAVLCAGDCGKRVDSRKRILEWCATNHAAVTRWPRRYCPPCDEVHQAEVAKREAEQRAKWAQQRAEQQAREEAERAARRQELADLRTWALEVLADPNTVILDTETTGLHDTARIVDIAVITATGETLIDTLINPGEPIPAESTDIHGITDGMVAEAPTFGAVLPDIEDAIRGKRILIYNESYDVARLLHEYQRWCAAQTMYYSGPDDEPAAVAKRWIGKLKTEDAMEPYSAWYGDWNDYHGNYRWQRLNGGHRAHGDCLAVIDCLKAVTLPLRE